METQIKAGTIFRLYGTWLDEIHYGIYIALQDFTILECDEQIGRNTDKADEYVQSLMDAGHIRKLDIPEFLISQQ